MSEPLDRMTCESAFRWLDDYLDRQLSLDEMRLVEAHLRVCEVCTRSSSSRRACSMGCARNSKWIAAPPDLLAPDRRPPQPPQALTPPLLLRARSTP